VVYMKKELTVILLLILSIGIVTATTARVLVSPDPSFIVFQLGKEDFQEKIYDRAIENFKKAIEFNPEFEEAYYNLGASYYYSGDIENAIINFNKAIELDPNYEKAYYSLGLLYFAEKDNDKSIYNFKHSLALNPANPNNNFDLAVSFIEKFREKEASGFLTTADLTDLENGIIYYQKTLVMDPNFPNAQSNLDIVKKVLKEYS